MQVLGEIDRREHSEKLATARKARARERQADP